MTKSAFWNSFKKAVTVNPKVSTGLPDAAVYRIPAPGGQPATHVPKEAYANDIAQNPYYGRDFRRNFPRLAVYSQQEVAGLLAAKEALALGGGESSALVTKAGETGSLTEVIKASNGLYSVSKLPPTPVVKKYKWVKGDQPPVGPGTYWPMVNWKTA